jgi:predicted nucleic acid-binding protein
MIDTNVILDALMVREPWAEAAQAVLLAVAEEKVQGFITASTVTDIYYIVRKALGDKERAKQALLGLFTAITVLDVTGVDCEKAMGLSLPDYEDALLACCGKRHKVDLIVTRNVKHFAGSPIKAVVPEEILKKLAQK